MTTHACGLEVTHCDDCGAGLEEGQTGQCEDCAPERTCTFAELSEKAKENARNKLRYSEHYLRHEWWDGVYEDAARVATILGLDIMESRRSRNGKSFLDPAINFSGFSSQGDGACFHGEYAFNPKAVEEIKAYCSDAELLRITTGLMTLQLTRRLLGLEPFSATITTSGRYSHSGSMSVEVTSEGIDADSGEPEEIDEGLEDEVTQLMRDFADWIYKSLEAEHDHLMSDDVVDEQLVDENFDEFGVLI